MAEWFSVLDLNLDVRDSNPPYYYLDLFLVALSLRSILCPLVSQLVKCRAIHL